MWYIDTNDLDEEGGSITDDIPTLRKAVAKGLKALRTGISITIGNEESGYATGVILIDKKAFITHRIHGERDLPNDSYDDFLRYTLGRESKTSKVSEYIRALNLSDDVARKQIKEIAKTFRSFGVGTITDLESSLGFSTVYDN